MTLNIGRRERNQQDATNLVFIIKLLASKQTAVSAWQMPFAVVQSWTPDDGREDRPKHVECHSKIK